MCINYNIKLKILFKMYCQIFLKTKIGQSTNIKIKIHGDLVGITIISISITKHKTKTYWS